MAEVVVGNGRFPRQLLHLQFLNMLADTAVSPHVSHAQNYNCLQVKDSVDKNVKYCLTESLFPYLNRLRNRTSPNSHFLNVLHE